GLHRAGEDLQEEEEGEQLPDRDLLVHTEEGAGDDGHPEGDPRQGGAGGAGQGGEHVGADPGGAVSLGRLVAEVAGAGADAAPPVTGSATPSGVPSMTATPRATPDRRVPVEKDREASTWARASVER